MWDKLKSWLKMPAVAVVSCLLLALLLPAGIWIAKRYFNLEVSIEVSTHFGAFVTPIIGILAVWLGFIRFGAFIKQNRADALNRCIEQMSNQESASMRIAGIRGLEVLAQGNQDDTEFLKQVCGILQGFIDERAPARDAVLLDEIFLARNLPPLWNLRAVSQAANLSEKKTAKLKEWDSDWENCEAEVTRAILISAQILAVASKISHDPDLSLRYMPYLQILTREGDKSSLRKANLFASFLPHAHFSNMDLSEASLFNTYLRGARLQNTDLKRALFWDADLRGVDLTMAKLQNTRFYKVKLEDADFTDANLKGAVYYENNSNFLKDANKAIPKHGKPVTKDWLKAQWTKNWNKAIGIPDR